jgi:Phage capsid protein
MADNTVQQIKYAKELQNQYQIRQSYLRGTVTTEGTINGNQYVFSIEGKAGIAQERGSNGLFVQGDDDQYQTGMMLKEYGSYRRKRNFNIHTSPVDQRKNMQNLNIIEINKRTDKLILDELATTTFRPYGLVGSVMTLSKALEIGSIHDTAVITDMDRIALVSPKLFARLMAVEQFSSSRYVTDVPFMKKVEARSWNGYTWIKHPGLPGVGTNASKCYFYHKGCIGHGLVMGDTAIKSGVNEEHAYSWANAISMQGAKLILPEGCLEFVHDDVAVI